MRQVRKKAKKQKSKNKKETQEFLCYGGGISNDMTKTWTFGFKDIIVTYLDEIRNGITYSTIVDSRPRTPEDPPFEPPKGSWVQKGKAWIFTPS